MRFDELVWLIDSAFPVVPWRIVTHVGKEPIDKEEVRVTLVAYLINVILWSGTFEE